MKSDFKRVYKPEGGIKMSSEKYYNTLFKVINAPKTEKVFGE